MIFLKYICFILIFLSSTSIGFLISKKYANRTKELNCFYEYINILQNKIKFNKIPISDIFEEMAEINLDKNISEIFLDFSKKIKKMSLQKAWKESIENKINFLSLNREDIAIIVKIGETLGKNDVEGETNNLNGLNILLQNQIKKSEYEQNKSEKMYKSIGAIIGIAIVILLF